MSIATAMLVAAFAIGCASTPKKPLESSGVIFHQSLEETRKAAVDALVVLGFDIKKQAAAYVEGFRPRKVGFFVGSGGETVGIWLESLENDSTRVIVKTAKSFVGIVGQKNWDEEIIKEMEKTRP